MADIPRNHPRQFMLIGGPLHGFVHELAAPVHPQTQAVGLPYDEEILWYQPYPERAVAEFEFSEPVHP